MKMNDCIIANEKCCNCGDCVMLGLAQEYHRREREMERNTVIEDD